MEWNSVEASRKSISQLRKEWSSPHNEENVYAPVDAGHVEGALGFENPDHWIMRTKESEKGWCTMISICDATKPAQP
eukprot:3946646-Amphidinium_carterae.1